MAASSSAAKVKVEDLAQYIDRTGWQCINEQAPKHTLRDAFIHDTDHYLQSDADEELIIALPFTVPVAIDGLQFHVKKPRFGPRKIRVFIDRGTMDFEDVHDSKPDAELEIDEEALSTHRTLPLDPLKFGRVRKLTIFVESNQGDEEQTQIGLITVLGRAHASTNMNNLRKVG